MFLIVLDVILDVFQSSEQNCNDLYFSILWFFLGMGPQGYAPGYGPHYPGPRGPGSSDHYPPPNSGYPPPGGAGGGYPGQQGQRPWGPGGYPMGGPSHNGSGQPSEMYNRGGGYYGPRHPYPSASGGNPPTSGAPPNSAGYGSTGQGYPSDHPHYPVSTSFWWLYFQFKRVLSIGNGILCWQCFNICFSPPSPFWIVCVIQPKPGQASQGGPVPPSPGGPPGAGPPPPHGQQGPPPPPSTSMPGPGVPISKSPMPRPQSPQVCRILRKGCLFESLLSLALNDSASRLI